MKMHKDKQKSAPVCLAAALLLVCLFTQATTGFRLTKKESQDEETTVDGGGGDDVVHEGRIVFGRGLETSAPNASIEDDGSYQADSPGWVKGSSSPDLYPKASRWGHLKPSVHCSSDQIRFKAYGPGTSQLTLAHGHGPALPLSQIPPSCGYNMQRNALALVMSVPYDGCSVVQQGGNYVLPLRWQGIPLLLLCTKPPGSPLASAASYPPITKYPPPPIYLPPTLPHSHLPDPHQHLLPPQYPQYPDVKLHHPIYVPPQQYPVYPPPHVGYPAIPIKTPHYRPALHPFLPPPTIIDPSQVLHYHTYPPVPHPHVPHIPHVPHPHPHIPHIPHPHVPLPGYHPGAPHPSIITELVGNYPVPQIQPHLPYLPPPAYPHDHPHPLPHPHYPTDPNIKVPSHAVKLDPYNPHIYVPSHSQHQHSQSIPLIPPHGHPHLPHHLLRSHSPLPQSDQPPPAYTIETENKMTE